MEPVIFTCRAESHILGSIVEGATMPSADDIWEWIHAPLEELKNDLSAEPDKLWETRRAEFLEHLGLSEPSQYPAIGHLLEHLDQLAEEDRATLISSGEIDSVAYQIAQQYDESEATGHGEPAATETSGYDEQAWHAYLAENGPYWNGTEEAWPQFREWFIYHATERGLGEPATALLDYLNAQPAAERITTFAQYSVTINPIAPQPEEPETGELSSQEIDDMMAEVLAENPELADIPEERRREIMAEILGQVQS
jgi:hypothetical protein